MKTKLTLLLLWFCSFLFLGCFSQKNNELHFEKKYGFMSNRDGILRNKDDIIPPPGTIQIKCKYVVDSLLIKVRIYDKDELDDDISHTKFHKRFDTIKGRKFFGNFRDKDGYDLFNFPITISDNPFISDGRLLYHIGQNKIEIPRELFDMIDSFYFSVNYEN